jgi:signal transduction histidine kinase
MEAARPFVTGRLIGAAWEIMLNMRERAEKLGGTCSIESSAGEGTTITWTVPLS